MNLPSARITLPIAVALLLASVIWIIVAAQRDHALYFYNCDLKRSNGEIKALEANPIAFKLKPRLEENEPYIGTFTNGQLVTNDAGLGQKAIEQIYRYAASKSVVTTNGAVEFSKSFIVNLLSEGHALLSFTNCTALIRCDEACVMIVYSDGWDMREFHAFGIELQIQGNAIYVQPDGNDTRYNAGKL